MRSSIFILILIVSLLLVPVVMAEDALEWYTRGQNAAMAGNYDLAVTYYNNALSQNPNYAQALGGKAAALNAQGKYAEALVAADESLAIRSSDVVALNARAHALYGLGNYEESAAAYDNLFVYQQNKADAYCNQGYAYLQLEDYQKAVVSYDRCTAMDPLNFMSWNYMGTAYMGMEKYDQALTSFDKATGVTVTNATVWNSKGLALAALDRPQDALECFKKALGINPEYAEALKNREEMSGQQQTIHIIGTITPEPTISRIGTFYTTATPVQEPVVVTTAVGSTSVEETMIPGATTPVPKRTTYSPVSPLTILAALGVAGCAALCLFRK